MCGLQKNVFFLMYVFDVLEGSTRKDTKSYLRNGPTEYLVFVYDLRKFQKTSTKPIFQAI